MIEKGIIKLKDIVFIYSKPPEEALVGIVNNIDYPTVSLKVVPRDGKNKFGEIQKIDLSKNIALTILDNNKINDCLTSKECKRLDKISKENEVVDLFAGTY